MTELTPGSRFVDMDRWDELRRSGPHIWHTLGYRRTALSPGSTTVEWDAPVDYCFPSGSGPIVQGGMVTALLDAAMGGACWTVLDRDQVFLTADLRVEFLRSCRPGTLRAVGEVVRRTRRVVFCSAQLHDTDGVVLAASRCTQVVLPADGRAARYDTQPAAAEPNGTEPNGTEPNGTEPNGTEPVEANGTRPDRVESHRPDLGGADRWSP